LALGYIANLRRKNGGMEESSNEDREHREAVRDPRLGFAKYLRMPHFTDR
jgi:hypothetical protein